MAYNTDGILGPGFAQEDSSAKHTLGTRVQGTDGTIWQYCLAGEAIAAYDCVAIDEDHTMKKMTKALADDGHRPGFAQMAFTNAYYGWVAIHGSNINVTVLGSCAADAALYTSATSGALDDSATSQTEIHGLVIVASAATASTNKECIANTPHVNL
jgi:hypothetical protein